MKKTLLRLLVLAVVAVSLAIPAVAGSICGAHNATCPDGTSTGAIVCCGSGSGYAECACETYNSDSGWSNCELIAGCY